MDLTDKASAVTPKITLDYQLLRHTIRGSGEYQAALTRASLLPITLKDVPFDRVENGYNNAMISSMSRQLSDRGHNLLPIRVFLLRQDFDLIHNFLAPQLEQLHVKNPPVAAAFQRLLVKAHETRTWADTVQPQMLTPLEPPPPPVPPLKKAPGAK